MSGKIMNIFTNTGQGKWLIHVCLLASYIYITICARGMKIRWNVNVESQKCWKSKILGAHIENIELTSKTTDSHCISFYENKYKLCWTFQMAVYRGWWGSQWWKSLTTAHDSACRPGTLVRTSVTAIRTWHASGSSTMATPPSCWSPLVMPPARGCCVYWTQVCPRSSALWKFHIRYSWYSGVRHKK